MQLAADVTSRSAVPDSPVVAPWHAIVQATLKRNDVKRTKCASAAGEADSRA